MIALYSRVSTQEQALHGNSIDEQQDRMEKYCDALNWINYKHYIDAGFSGATTDRPALQRLIKDVKAKKVDRVLVYKLDRLSRSQKDTLTLIDDVFLANGCDFVSMSENFDTASPFGRAMIGILAVFAQLEREQIKERMIMGKEARAKQGKFHGSGNAPIGYDYIDGKLIVNDFEKIQIKFIFDQYASGKSPHYIMDKLNESGQYHKHGKWKEYTIRGVLDKKTYIGYTSHHGEWYKGNHEPIIDEPLFEKVQAIRELKTEEFYKTHRRQGNITALLAGFLYCGKCGARYRKIRKKAAGKTYEYYACYSRIRTKPYMVKDPDCKNKSWNSEKLEQIVFDQIGKLALDPDYIVALQATSDDDRQDVITTEIAKLDDQMNRLMDLYALDQIPIDTLQKRIHDLADQKAKLEEELSQINEKTHARITQEETVRLVSSFGDILDHGDIDEIRLVLSALIDRIIIDGNDLTIHWNFT